MKRLLKRGDTFRVGKLPHHKSFVYKHDFVKGILKNDENRITVDYGGTVGWTEHQTRPGGWKRDVDRTLDVTAKGVEKITWRVYHTSHDGGGTGHGPGDVYPDGHHVHAENVANVHQTLDFYQTGCFIPEILPESIELVEE